MASVNKVILIGTLGRDPEVRYAEDGTSFARISMACNEKWKSKDGETKEKVEWINVSFAGRVAEIVGEYVRKGDPLYVEGKFTTRKWQDKDGNDRYSSEVRGHAVQLLRSKGSRDDELEKPAPQTKPAPGDIDDEEIPF